MGEPKNIFTGPRTRSRRPWPALPEADIHGYFKEGDNLGSTAGYAKHLWTTQVIWRLLRLESDDPYYMEFCGGEMKGLCCISRCYHRICLVQQRTTCLICCRHANLLLKQEWETSEGHTTIFRRACKIAKSDY